MCSCCTPLATSFLVAATDGAREVEMTWEEVAFVLSAMRAGTRLYYLTQSTCREAFKCFGV